MLSDVDEEEEEEEEEERSGGTLLLLDGEGGVLQFPLHFLFLLPLHFDWFSGRTI